MSTNPLNDTLDVISPILRNKFASISAKMGEHPLVVFISSNIASFFIGLSIGLFMLGWWLLPVTYKPAGYNTLADTYKIEIVYATADLFAYSLNTSRASAVLGSWGGQLACELAREEPNLDMRQRLLALTYVTGDYCEN